jgi:hypothetical protein
MNARRKLALVVLNLFAYFVRGSTLKKVDRLRQQASIAQRIVFTGQ